VGKTQDKKLVDAIKKKFKLKKWDRGFEIESIDDQVVAFSSQLLAEKITRKGRHNQVAAHFIKLGS